MKEDIETLTIRLNAMTGGFAVLQALLYAVVRTHPNPLQLSEAFEQFVQGALAQHTQTPYGDELLDGLHTVADQLRQEFRSLGT